MEVAGRKGRFDWSEPAKFYRGIGGGKSPMHKFVTDDGNVYFHRLEGDKQGGRWELSGQSDEYEEMKRNPKKIEQMWGNSDVATALKSAIKKGVSWEDLPEQLKGVNTWRQISADEED